MWILLKRLFLASLFIIWGLTLVNLILVSAFTFVLFNICLTIFLCWLIPTLTAWSIALIPILKFVFIPWHRQQCRSWTINDQKSRLSIAFFHPYCHYSNGHERVLWTTVESILRTYPTKIQIIIYTGDIDIISDEILHRVKQRFNIDLEVYKESITFINLQSRFLLEAKYYKIWTTLGQNLGSIIVGFEALIRFIPDIYIDSMGYAFTYPCFYYFASIPIISYIHYSTISNDLFEQVNERYLIYNNHQLITNSSLLNSKMKLIYYDIFSYLYGWCGRCSTIVYCNSLRTKKQIEFLWKLPCIHLVYPPCDIEQFVEMSKDEQMMKTIVSIGQFRLEKNHELQIRAFHQLLQRFRRTEDQQKLKLILIGSARHNDDREYIEQLQALVDNLNISDKVQFKVNINFEELKVQLNQAIIGLHTISNGHFGIGL